MTQIDSPLTAPALQTRAGKPWKKWAILWAVVAAALVTLLANNAFLDTYLWCVTRWVVGDVPSEGGGKPDYTWATYHAAHAGDAAKLFYMDVSPPFGSKFYSRTERLWTVLKAFGEPWMATIVFFLIAAHARQKWFTALAAATAMALAGGAGALIRMADGRFRPTHTNGTNTWEFLRGFHDGHDLSFPSGHATLAFAMAAVLTSLSPRGKIVFISVAAGCAISRVVMEAHFWSDILFGAALGWTIGWTVIQIALRSGKKLPELEFRP